MTCHLSEEEVKYGYKILSGGFISPHVKITMYFLQRNQTAVETEEGGEPKLN